MIMNNFRYVSRNELIFIIFFFPEDPYMAAQKFLEKNEIGQGYLDEVAKFIIKNTEGVTLGVPATQYQDPFTGKESKLGKRKGKIFT